MRRLAGIGIMLLGLAGCQSLPALVRIEVDGSTLEFKKKVPPAPEPPAPEDGQGSDALAG
ncbi:MAG TPA: hypothetical protein VEC11_10220 [Allosphingosinicella sp.]|nr:hypothetical protein [Allosphingosinicella sp.]